MTKEKFKQKLNEIIENASFLDIETTGDFQSGETLGFPTVLSVYWDKGKAWLSLNENLINDDMDITEYEQACANWGIRDCNSVEEFNSLLESLGEEAYRYALPTEESIEQSM